MWLPTYLLKQMHSRSPEVYDEQTSNIDAEKIDAVSRYGGVK